MIVHLREAGPLGRLSGAALLAAVLLSVGACADYTLGSVERAPGAMAMVEAAPPKQHAAAAPQERMPSRFERADADMAAPMPRAKPASLLLTVSEGDTVHRIARQHGVTPRAIISLNGLSEPYWLLAGQQLRVPLEPVSVARATTTEIAAPTHEVRVTTAEPLTPAGDARVTEVERATPAREEGQAFAVMDSADPHAVRERPAPMPPESPGPRLARAESPQPAPSSLSVLARQVDVSGVPLPPTRNTFLWPIEGRVISRFGSKPDGKHNDGINIAVPVGSAVRAAQHGVVAYAGNELRGYGNLVLIRHDGGWMTAYAHNDSLLVGKGDVVQRGQVISRSGKSGRVSRPQAHFEIRRDGEPQDPLRLLTRK